MIHVEEISQIEQLDGYRLLWSAMWRQTPGATFFQSPDWLEVYWRHFSADQRLRVLVVHSDSRPVGILPLVVRRESTRVGSVRVLTYPLHDWGTFYGPIGPNATATLAAGLRHIHRTPRDWDMLDLRWIDLAGCDRGRTEGAMQRAGLSCRVQAWDRAPRVELDGVWDDYWNGRDKKWRHNVERLGRRLAQQGELTLLRYRPAAAADGDGDPRWDLYEQCLEIARKSWQGSSTNGTTLSHESVAAYLRDTHAAAARSGSLDLNLLLLGGVPLAFAYNYCCQGQVYALRTGFDPAFSSLRPGATLLRLVLEDSFRRGDTSYDLGVGSLDVKRHWQTSLATSYRHTYFPPTISRAQLLRLKRWFEDRLYGPEHAACSWGTFSPCATASQKQ